MPAEKRLKYEIGLQCPIIKIVLPQSVQFKRILNQVVINFGNECDVEWNVATKW